MVIIFPIGSVCVLIECYRYFITQIRCTWTNPSYIKSEVILIHHIVYITNCYIYLFDMKYLFQKSISNRFYQKHLQIKNLIWNTKTTFLCLYLTVLNTDIDYKINLSWFVMKNATKMAFIGVFPRQFSWTSPGQFSFTVFPDNFYEMFFQDPYWQHFWQT